jgi:hypothetical protein
MRNGSKAVANGPVALFFGNTAQNRAQEKQNIIK